MYRLTRKYTSGKIVVHNSVMHVHETDAIKITRNLASVLNNHYDSSDSFMLMLHDIDGKLIRSYAVTSV